ncbi:B-cell receptor CD22-like isoform X2 [Danio rerio]|uniref:B-cell receptor CD22-like isoform X2 n=1 Tax=Danio rerio TaxID=7955 RepID=A0AC58G115_DANRE
MLMWLRMAPALHLIFLLIIHMVSSADWAVSYRSLTACALKNSSVIMSCYYKYPTQHQIMKVFWTKYPERNGDEYPDLSEDPEYSLRLQYLGDKQHNCTLRLSHVTERDEREYYCRITTNVTEGRWIGVPGVVLSVTDLQLESPERVTEGDSVRLTCNSSCKLTDTPTFIWYRNSHTLTVGNIENQLILKSVRREDAGRYRCAVHGHTLTSPEVYLNVMYAPKKTFISVSPCCAIMAGDSVTLSCSSDSNPPALNLSFFKGETSVGSGRIFNISKISSDDSGEYKCRATNEHGEKYSDPVTLDVQFRFILWSPEFGVGFAVGVFLGGGSAALFAVIYICLSRRKSRRSAVKESVISDTYAGLDLQSATSNLYDTLTSVHHRPAENSCSTLDPQSSSEHHNPPINRRLQ